MEAPAPTPRGPDEPDHPAKARLDRWRRPIGSRRDRLAAWLNMVFADHGFLRWIYLNLHRVGEKAWRSAQPSPIQIRRLQGHGIRTIVNLRGGQSYGSLPLEIETCDRLGIAIENFVLRSRALPTLAEMQAARELFERIEYPVLFHCKSGADRAGMMSALYLAIHEGRPVAEARRQLSLRYGHIGHGPTGILDAFFDAYEADHPDGGVPLLEWAEQSYDPDAIRAAFKAGAMGSFLTERVLRRE